MNPTDVSKALAEGLASRVPVRPSGGLLTLMLGGLPAVIPLSTDLYLPGHPALGQLASGPVTGKDGPPTGGAR